MSVIKTSTSAAAMPRSVELFLVAACAVLFAVIASAVGFLAATLVFRVLLQ